MSEVVGTSYGDDKDKAETDDPVQERARLREHQGPGEGPNDQPATTGTHLDRIVGLRFVLVVAVARSDHFAHGLLVPS